MERSKQENVLVSFIYWHFYEMPKFLLLVWNNYISFAGAFFSVPLLIKTLFSPWRRYNWAYPKGFDAGAFFSTLITNIFSRLIGFLARVLLIVIGIAVQLFVLLAGAFIFLLWFALPLLFLFLIYFFLV